MVPEFIFLAKDALKGERDGGRERAREEVKLCGKNSEVG
jgi:hypothetical protein